jgi:hypothetical protein
MAKKRKSTKKHRFSPDHVQSSVTQAPAVQSNTSIGPAGPVPAVGFATAQIVRRDVIRVLMLAGAYIVLMILLWALFTHTGLGSTAYNAVKL